jgi:sugar lactone lactonase YvrE/thiol-disulfide isomerase/thioredoxin
VVLDFWTLGCINCQHIIPDLERLEEEFGDALTVVGVHSGKYETEHDDESIREAIRRYGLVHPVANDPDFTFWRRYGARAWPTLVIIDPAGKLVGYHAGEGVYPLFQPIIESLVAEFDEQGLIDRTPLPLDLEASAAASVLSYPGKVVADAAAGLLYIADSGHNRIVITTLEGAVQRVIGDGSEGFADGAPHEARFRQPQGLALSEDGRTLFVADTRNHAVRAVDLESAEVTTIAGTGRQLDRLPGPDSKGGETALGSPWDVVQDGGRLFIAMAGVHQIWVLDLESGGIEAFAGTSREGVDDGDRRSMATLAQPSGITAGDGFLFWVDPEGSAVRRVPLDGSGEVETLAGTGLFDFGDRDGDREEALLQHAQGIAFAEGRLFIADTYNHKLKQVDAAEGGALTLAGGLRGYRDGVAEYAQFDEPGGLSFAAGTLFIADSNNHAIRTLNLATGEVATLALTNLDLLSGPTPGEPVLLEEVALPAERASLRITIAAPGGHHLNALAPGQLLLSGDGVQLSHAELRWNTDDEETVLTVDLFLEGGTGTLRGELRAYYCRDGEEALCFIHEAQLEIPVRVAPALAGAEVRYDLPGDAP